MKQVDGSIGWMAVLAVVIGWDAYAATGRAETLSSAYYRALKHPVAKWPVLAIHWYLVAHLNHLLKDKYDPLRSSPRGDNLNPGRPV